MSNRRILVTGGAGFIGSKLVNLLCGRGDDVIVLDDLSTGRREHVPSGARLAVGDVRDADALRSLLDGVDLVFHLAARVSIRASVDAFRDDHDVNLGGTLALLSALRGTTVSRLVYASSMAVYADSPPGQRVSEEHSTVPQSPYGISKLAAEHYCRLLTSELGIEQVSLRYFNTWGPGQALTPYVGAATIFINALLDGRRPVIFGDGQQTRDFIHVDDVARATAAAGDAPLSHRALNVGTGTGTTVRALLEMIAAEVGTPAMADHAPARAEELRYSVADISQSTTVLGLRPRVPLEAGPLVDYWRRERR